MPRFAQALELVPAGFDQARANPLASRAAMTAESQLVADLYRRYAPAVHRRALLLTGDAQAALDVTQETFLAFMDARTRLRGEASAFTVLFQIATHKAVDLLRRRARWSGLLATVAFDDQAAESRAEPVETERDTSRRVEAMHDLALLTRGECQEVVSAAYLYFVERCTTEEVGQALGLSRKTIGKYLAGFVERARQRAARLEAERRP
ncbi:MAG: sigma-70 family RNA polymerase sigma factor [Deltaproteobacteria bacterium]|nr:sigma-70 family RNA polymerase sigma factor [Deltaproteobacteria bacterium]